MKYLQRLLLALLILSSSSSLGKAQGGKPVDIPKHTLSSKTSEPTIFGDGTISTSHFESHPAFMPDGKMVYFVRSTPNFALWTILFSRFERGRWAPPEIASFSGQYSDADPFITPDGKRLFFISNRPVAGKKTQDLDIWFVETIGNNSWGEPRNVGVPINSGGAEWYPTITRDGTLYFGSDRSGGLGRTDIYRSRLLGDKYTEPENLGGVINTQFNEFEPYIAPDETFLIFMAGGRQDSRGGFDLYISHLRNDSWSTPVNLGDRINSPGNEYSPMISPDARYFLWTSTRGFSDKQLPKKLNYQNLMNRLNRSGNGLGDIYYIDLGELGDSFRTQKE